MRRRPRVRAGDAARADPACCASTRARGPRQRRSPRRELRRAGRQARTLDLALDHLLREAPQRRRRRSRCRRRRAARSAALAVDKRRLHAVPGLRRRLPGSALADNPDAPQLRFIEKNCVQCGLCASTCPEDAITLRAAPAAADGGKARKPAARAERGRAVPLHPLRQAVRHAEGDRGDDRQARRPLDVPGRARPSA